MLQIPGHVIAQVLHEGRHTVILRAVRAVDGARVVLKTLRSEHPSLRDVAHLRHEYAVMSRFDDDGVVRVHGLLEFGARAALALEDFGGGALRERVPSDGMALRDFFAVASRLIRAVASVHAGGIHHNDINPGNVVVDASLQRVALIDFGVASRLAEERLDAAAPAALAGTLAYVSPEQTGRVNRPVDYRSDYYALGITFYELLTGTTPFVSTDPLELVHAHIARRPVPPRERRPELPQALSELVLRLLEKTAELRYQSTSGLLADLEKIQAALSGQGPVHICLGERDFGERFLLTSKLHGRERDVTALLAAFDRCCSGGNDLVLLAGPAGIGKSVLVRELHRSLIAHRGQFGAGKFEQLGRNSPYSALAQALRGLVLQILGESEAHLAERRAHLTTALTPNARALFDAFPELERLIGSQPAVPPLPPTESANRFHTTLRALIRALAGERHPIVIFLDDLQWSDPATFKLIEELAGDPDLAHILWIGAYRDDEVGPDHRLTHTLHALASRGASVEERRLAPLDVTAVAGILADTLRCDPAECAALARLIHDRTEGNPLFARTYLLSLHEQGILTFDRRRGVWTWTEGDLQRAALPDDVVDLVTRRLDDLTRHTRDLLAAAASCGNRFNLDIVARITHDTVSRVLADLWPAVERGLVRPVGDDYKYVADQPAAEFEFVHDRVQQAAYGAISEQERPRIHLLAGRNILALRGAELAPDDIYAVAGHLGRASTLLADGDERVRVAEIDLRAARQAKAATDYRTACIYLEFGIGLLSEDSWSTDYQLTYALHRERVECEYLAANPEAAVATFVPLLARARSAREKADLHALRAVLETNRGQLRAAVDAGRAGLALFGVSLPEVGTTDDVLRAFEEYQRLRAGVSNEALLAMPEVQDEDLRAEMRILVAMTAAAYFTDTNLASVMLLRIASLTLLHGPSEVSSYGLIGAGLVLSGAFGRYAEADEHGRIARDLNERFANAELRPRIGLFWATFMMVWTRPLAEAQEALRDAAEYGLQVGDIIYAVYSTVTTVFHALMAGEPLARVHERCDGALALVHRRGLEDQACTLRHVRRLFTGLAEPSAADINTSDLRAAIDDARTPLAMFYYHYYEALVAYLFDDLKGARMLIARGKRRLAAAFGSGMVADFTFLECMILARWYAEVGPDERGEITARIAHGLEQLAVWARSAPFSFGHREALARGEWARVNSDETTALRCYNQAIALARENHAPHIEGLACECALRLAEATDAPILAGAYLSEALAAYRIWGAHAKVTRLARLYAHHVVAGRDGTRPDADSAIPALDRGSLLKALATLSAEIHLDALLGRLLRLALENAGAERGVLVLDRDGAWYVEAMLSATAPDAVDRRSRLWTEVPLPTSIILYCARSRQDVVLEDAAHHGTFTRDPYVQQHRPRSVVCVPLVGQGRLVGLLYLENNLASGSFTTERCEVLHFLAAQAAVSLENSFLYARLAETNRSLEARVHERTQALQTALDDLRRAQRRVVESEKLAALGGLVAGVAHEINTPLGIGVTAASTLVDSTTALHASYTAGRMSRDDFERYLDRTRRGGEILLANLGRAVALIQSFKQIAVDQSSEAPRAFRVREYIEQVLLSLHPERRRVPHNVTIEGDETLTLRSQPGALSQLLTNLIMNSLVHAWPDGEPNADRSVTIAFGRVADRFELTYADNGRGIATEHLGRIFEPFFTTRRDLGGSGLGLSIVYNIVTQQLHGDIVVESVPGRGALFRLTMPAIFEDAFPGAGT